jgi:hypothetical protein
VIEALEIDRKGGLVYDEFVTDKQDIAWTYTLRLPYPQVKKSA